MYTEKEKSSLSFLFVATEVVKEESIRVRIDKKLKEKLRTMCDNRKITISEFIINAIENEVKNRLG